MPGSKILLLLLVSVVLVSCRDDEAQAQERALAREAERLRQENAEKQARIRELKDQIEAEAAAMEETLRENEAIAERLEEAKAANAPLAEKVREAEMRVLEMEEMHKEVKKLE